MEKIDTMLDALGRLVNIQRRYTWRWFPYRPDPDGPSPDNAPVPPHNLPESSLST